MKITSAIFNSDNKQADMHTVHAFSHSIVKNASDAAGKECNLEVVHARQIDGIGSVATWGIRKLEETAKM